ncbi:hypothetical protein VTK56DRAFT_5138 [Thermocarpiscus australiensis]
MPLTPSLRSRATLTIVDNALTSLKTISGPQWESLSETIINKSKAAMELCSTSCNRFVDSLARWTRHSSLQQKHASEDMMTRISANEAEMASALQVANKQWAEVEHTAKVIRYGGTSSNDLVKCARRWRMEKDILDRLRHQRSIVSLQAFDGRLFAVYLERLPSSLHGGTNSPFQLSDAFIILRDISSALSYLDTQHVAHNDIKPANITYSPQRGAVLIDFEMATSTTGHPSSGGTPWYLPPEFVKSPKNRGTLGDIWALGVTLLYVLGKIGLPEKTVEPWRMYDVADKHKEARGEMKAWLHFVAVKRQGLDCADRVQGLPLRQLVSNPAVGSPTSCMKVNFCLVEDLQRDGYSATRRPSYADQLGFILIYACWNVHNPASLTHNGGGDAGDIVSMVQVHPCANTKATLLGCPFMGGSSGAMMTNVLAGTYPEHLRGRRRVLGTARHRLERPRCPRTRSGPTCWALELTRTNPVVPSAAYTHEVYGDGSQLQGFFGQGVGHIAPSNEPVILQFFGLMDKVAGSHRPMSGNKTNSLYGPMK